jgi:hypothetical protein
MKICAAVIVSTALAFPIAAHAEIDRVDLMQFMERNCHNYVLAGNTFRELLSLGFNV